MRGRWRERLQGVVRMPNRYQREIEEILSRMEEDEPHRGFGDRGRPKRRAPSRGRSLPSIHVAIVDLLILIAVVLAMVATGFAFYDGAPGLISGIIGMAALVLFVVALVVGWRDRFRPPSKPAWRGSTDRPVTPIRRGPFSALAARLRVRRLRQQYRRAERERHDD